MFLHDCKECRFLGTITKPALADVYLCDDTILARTGNEPYDYASWSVSTLESRRNDTRNMTDLMRAMYSFI